MRVGIVGYGHLGEYLVRNILKDGAIYNIEISFVWNRSAAKLVGKIDEDLILTNLDDFALRKADLIVEVCHPEICKKYGKRFLQHSDLFIGSPTGFADNETEVALKSAADHYKHAIYVPSGALWGAADIKSMADRGFESYYEKTPKSIPITRRTFRFE